MKKFTLMASFCLLFNCIYSQCYPVFRDLSKQPPIYGNEPVREIYSFYYVHTGYSSNFDKKSPFMFSMWDGNTWKTIGNDYFRGSMPSLLQWDKRLIATGIFYEVNNIKAPPAKFFRFVEYKNGSWDTIPGCTFDSIANPYIIGGAVATRDGLYYLMTDASGAYSGFVYKYDTSQQKFIKICQYKGGSPLGARLYGGDRRVLLSNVSEVNNITARGFAYIDNDSLKINTDTSFTPDHYYAIDGSNDHIYAMIGDKNSVVLEFGNSLVQRRNTLGNVISYINAMSVHKGTVISQSKDDKDNTYIHVLCPGGVSWATMLKHADGTSDHLTNPYACRTGVHLKYITGSSTKTMELAEGAILSGTAYIDNDSNCNHDSSEQLLPGYLVRTESRSYSGFAITDKNGRYEMFVYPETVKVGGKGRLSACAGTNTVTAVQGNAYTKDLPVEKPVKFDIKVRFLNGHAVRWDSKVLYTAEIENLGMPFDSAAYEFRLDKRLKIDGKSQLDYINGHVGGGKLYNLGYFEQRKISLLAWIDTGTTRPDSVLCHEVLAFLDTSEIDSSNNYDKICQKVVYSFDPNHKDCNKQNILPGKSTRLDYYIGFQNEGNDDAYDVVLVDSLSESFSIESLEIIGASHSYTVSLLGRVLKVTFKDIYLKPKKQDEQLSQGYFKFSIQTKEGLENGHLISNTAYIYFDLNKPVITNAAVVRVADEESGVIEVKKNKGRLSIYPNPGNGLLQLVGGANETVRVYSMNGELVYSTDSGQGNVEIDIRSWPPGLYVVRCGSAIATYMKTE